MTGWIVLGAALLLVVPAVVDAIFQPNQRRLAWRNLWRRKSEAALVTLGTLLGTAIIVASFVVGATIKDAGLSDIYNTHGPIDEAVTIDDPSQLDALTQAIADADLQDVDGTLAILSMPTVVTTTGPDPLGRPSIWVAEVDFEQARAFGGDAEASGFGEAGPTPGPGQTVIVDAHAALLDVAVGDDVVVHAYGGSVTLEVVNIIERNAAAGWNSVYVPLGTIENLFDPESSQTARPPRAEVVVSNTGDIFAGADFTDSVTTQLEAATAHLEGVEIDPVKADAITSAAEDGTEFTTLFNGIGSFAVIAGILLIVNLFVMLAEERKTQLGILRAIGFRRHQVTRAFGIEGAMYAVAASVAGSGLGVGIGWVLVRALKAVFLADDAIFQIGFAAPLERLAMGAGIGLILSMITIWVTAIRIAKFNVIAAIRDLPNPPAKSHALRSVLLSFIGIAAGLGIGWLGYNNPTQALLVAGPGIAAFSAIPILRMVFGSSIGAAVMGLGAMVWGTTVFSLFPDQMTDADIDTFVVQGLVLVTGAIIVSGAAQRLWIAGVNSLGRFGIGLSTRLGLAYPMARRVRTGLLLGMFSLVIFMVTFLSVFSGIFVKQAESFAIDASAGNTIIVDSASVNPVSASDLTSIEGVASVTPFVQGWTEFTNNGDDEPQGWRITGFDESFLAQGSPKLSSRSDAYATDLAVFEVVLTDDTLIIVDGFFLDGNDDAPTAPSLGDHVSVINSDTEELHDVEIVGVMANDFMFAGSFTSASFANQALGQRALPGLFFASADDGASPSVVAARLNARLIDHGVEAITFEAAAAEDTSELIGIMNLFKGFLSLGLAIGVAGLAVVLIRAVRERRRSIGVLRALGYQEKTVRAAFLIEASFVAIQGALIGTGLGVLTAYQVLVKSNTFGDGVFDFSVPWVSLGYILVIPTVAALLAAAVPAVRASRISPAVALRTD